MLRHKRKIISLADNEVGLHTALDFIKKEAYNIGYGKLKLMVWNFTALLCAFIESLEWHNES